MTRFGRLKTIIVGAVLALSLFGAAQPASALSDQQELVDKARITFDKLISSSDFSQLPYYVKKARALIIFPTLVKGGFIVGGEGGSGVLVVRHETLGWSYPAFYTLAAGSVGLQIGGQVAEVVFTVMSDRAVDAVLDNQFKFGGDISVAIGPIGQGLEASTTTNFDADMYQFAKTAGLFGGMSLEGAGILKRDSWNDAYYGQGATPYAIVMEGKFSNPNAQTLRDALAPY
ncbi:MAG: lipid-binding SYLF domain-containing protein [Dongiaceae bacterium]